MTGVYLKNLVSKFDLGLSSGTLEEPTVLGKRVGADASCGGGGAGGMRPAPWLSPRLCYGKNNLHVPASQRTNVAAAHLTANHGGRLLKSLNTQGMRFASCPKHRMLQAQTNHPRTLAQIRLQSSAISQPHVPRPQAYELLLPLE